MTHVDLVEESVDVSPRIRPLEEEGDVNVADQVEPDHSDGNELEVRHSHLARVALVLAVGGVIVAETDAVALLGDPRRLRDEVQGRQDPEQASDPRRGAVTEHALDVRQLDHGVDRSEVRHESDSPGNEPAPRPERILVLAEVEALQTEEHREEEDAHRQHERHLVPALIEQEVGGRLQDSAECDVEGRVDPPRLLVLGLHWDVSRCLDGPSRPSLTSSEGCRTTLSDLEPILNTFRNPASELWHEVFSGYRSDTDKLLYTQYISQVDLRLDKDPDFIVMPRATSRDTYREGIWK